MPRLPTTSYGYAPPPDARAAGWHCPKCSRTEPCNPSRWPYPCPDCRKPTDPLFEPPWSHTAEGYRFRHARRFDPDPAMRAHAEMGLHAWAYKNAWQHNASAEAAEARRAFRSAAAEIQRRGYGGAVEMARFTLMHTAVEAGDLGGMGVEILNWYPTVDTTDVEDHNGKRTAARQFVASCAAFLTHPESIGHPMETAVEHAMHDVAERAAEVMTPAHTDALREIRRVRGRAAESARLAEANWSLGVAAGGMPPVLPPTRRWGIARGKSWSATDRRLREAESVIMAARAGRSPERLAPTLHQLVAVLTDHGPDQPLFPRIATTAAAAAFVLAETQDDAANLDAAADRLAAGDTEGRNRLPSLAFLMRAYARLTSADSAGDLERAIAALQDADVCTDLLASTLRSDVRAWLSWLKVRSAPDAIGQAIDDCIAARSFLPGPTGSADIILARLHLWRALRSGTARDQRVADLEHAIQLVSKHCRDGRFARCQALLIRSTARHTLQASAGVEEPDEHARTWRAVAGTAATSSTVDQARVAQAWVAWALETNEPDLAAEAYHHLMSILPRDAASRYWSKTRESVLSRAQEHTEEAGYWLARARRYRDAVVALETGRAVALSLAGGPDRAAAIEALEQSGHTDLSHRYRRAVAALDAAAGRPATGESTMQHWAWAEVRTLAQPIAAATGFDPLQTEVTYADITAATRDEVVVYLAAAKAGGYALVVAGNHDPQFVELPHFDRASIAMVREWCLPDTAGEMPSPKLLSQGLRWLWEKGLGRIVLDYAGARILTMIPIGGLSLLPLHAAGDPGPPGDQATGWRHAGNFSSVRYAPNARTLRRCRATADALVDGGLALLAVDGHRPGDGLEYVSAETTEAARRWGGRPAHVEHGCTWATFRARASGREVWHLACHGKGSPYSPQESVLHFADTEIGIDDLRTSFGWNPRRLVVLSACETNLTAISLPNEVIGFPSAMLQLGFAGVIATAWKVDDRASAYLMARFYHEWRHERRHPAVALNRAQQWLRHATRAELAIALPGVEPPTREHRFAHPQYWAAFAYTGA